MLLVKDFLNGQELDDSTRSHVECGALLLGVARVSTSGDGLPTGVDSTAASSALRASALCALLDYPVSGFLAMFLRIMRSRRTGNVAGKPAG